MTFKKLEHLLAYTVQKIEEKIIMKAKEAKNKIKGKKKNFLFIIFKISSIIKIRSAIDF